MRAPGRSRADGLPARARRRAPGRLRPRAGEPHRRRHDEAVPCAADPTDKIPECKPHIKRGEHTKLYRFSPSDYNELAAVWNGLHPETGDPLEVVDHAPEGVPPFDLPAQEGVFAPDYAPEEIAEIAKRLRQAAGLSDEPTGVVANDTNGVVGKIKDAVS